MKYIILLLVVVCMVYAKRESIHSQGIQLLATKGLFNTVMRRQSKETLVYLIQEELWNVSDPLDMEYLEHLRHAMLVQYGENVANIEARLKDYTPTHGTEASTVALYMWYKHNTTVVE